MAGKHTGLINTLQKALMTNYKKQIFIAQEQFYSQQQERYITMYVLQEPVWDATHTHYTKRQVLKTASQVDVVKYLGNLYKNLREEQEINS